MAKNKSSDAGEVEEEPLSEFEIQARAEVAAMTPSPAPKGVTEEQLAAKVAAGLTRDQAVEVLERQRDWDKRNKG